VRHIIFMFVVLLGSGCTNMSQPVSVTETESVSALDQVIRSNVVATQMTNEQFEMWCKLRDGVLIIERMGSVVIRSECVNQESVRRIFNF
jgi:hypothetical protein